MLPLKYGFIWGLIVLFSFSVPPVQQITAADADEPAGLIQSAASLVPGPETMPESADESSAEFLSAEEEQSTDVERERMLEEEAEPDSDSFPEYDEESLELERRLFMAGEEDPYEEILPEEDEEFAQFEEDSIISEEENPYEDDSAEPEDKVEAENRP